MALWPLRKRIAQPVTGAQIRISNGIFGRGMPNAPTAEVDSSSHTGGLYNYHEGDLFYPGAQSFVFEPGFEAPVKSIWGGGGGNQGFLIAGDGNSRFSPLQPPQVYSEATVQTDGIGGLQAGQIALQPLLDQSPLLGGNPPNPWGVAPSDPAAIFAGGSGL
jgi:hypothetical protein